MSSTGDKDAALQRWRMLASALRTKQVPDAAIESASVRRFSSFEIPPREIVKGEDDDGAYIAYSLPTDVQLRIPSAKGQKVTAADLIGFDNTGNVCMCPPRPLCR